MSAGEAIARFGFVNGSSPHFRFSSGGRRFDVKSEKPIPWGGLHQLPPLFVDDYVVCGASTSLGFEFVIGGVVRLSAMSGGTITGERDFRPDDDTASRMRIKAGQHVLGELVIGSIAGFGAGLAPIGNLVYLRIAGHTVTEYNEALGKVDAHHHSHRQRFLPRDPYEARTWRPPGIKG